MRYFQQTMTKCDEPIMITVPVDDGRRLMLMRWKTGNRRDESGSSGGSEERYTAIHACAVMRAHCRRVHNL